ncbi:MAG: ATP-binding cassette domain-containing protein, partial [Epsilonproteobacteria bacterium]|nr:ATP-binding cassette domain-containing protein [Campylobacterota bacterium]
MHTLKVEKLEKVIKKTPIIKGVSLDVKSGEVVGLLGPNGAGKTTMFYMICGLIEPTSGAVYFDNQDVTHIPLHVRA